MGENLTQRKFKGVERSFGNLPDATFGTMHCELLVIFHKLVMTWRRCFFVDNLALDFGEMAIGITDNV
jgi:hypothetical protein